VPLSLPSPEAHRLAPFGSCTSATSWDFGPCVDILALLPATATAVIRSHPHRRRHTTTTDVNAPAMNPTDSPPALPAPPGPMLMHPHASTFFCTGCVRTHRANDGAFYDELLAYKSTNPRLKVLVSVGGWNFPSAHFSTMASNYR
jgi:hypothetical protein